MPFADPVLVYADPAQMEQMIMNLALNARDAMPEGGALTLEASAVPGEGNDLGAAVLTVSDTGVGINSAMSDRIFEPFFTTKEKGMSTGLGLATVHAIVKDAGGSISLESELGKGTSFRVCLPLTNAATSAEVQALETPAKFRGTETVLVVEDQDAVRAVAARVLRTYGYTVLVARHGRDALRTIGARRTSVDLVVSDIVMPEMHGRQLASELRAIAPGLRIVFMSGYNELPDGEWPLTEESIPLVRKPFTGVNLVSAVRRALDSN